MGKKLQFSVMGLCLIGLSSCSPNSDYTEMTVNIGVPVKKRAPLNLSNSMFSLMSVTLGVDCYQNEIYLLLHDPISDEVLETKKVLLRTELSNAITYGNAAPDVSLAITHITTNSALDEPLKMTVPKNRNLDIGLVGNFYQPDDLVNEDNSTGVPDGICDSVVSPAPGALALHSTSLFGHAVVDENIARAGVVTIPIDVLHTNPTGTYNLNSPPDRYKNWVQLSTNFSIVGKRTIGAGAIHSCSIVGGGIQCWGANGSGQLGDATYSLRTVPTTVSGYPTSSGADAISGGYAHTCAIINGAAKCWGAGGNGQLGDGLGSNSTTTPVQVTSLTSNVQKIAAGFNHSCAITAGIPQCWGQNSNGQLGDNTASQSLNPVLVADPAIGPAMIGVQDIATGDFHSCAIVSGGVFCWGANFSGQLGSNVGGFSYAPVQVSTLPTGSGATKVVAASSHTCALVNGAVQCWGAGNNGQLGNGLGSNGSITPVQVSGLTSGVQSITAAGSHTCAIVNGGVQCWGSNSNYQLGLGNNNMNSLVPAPVVGLGSGVSAIAAGGYHTCAIINGGEQCWGGNFNGQIGDNTMIPRAQPFNVQGLSTGSIDNARLIGVNYLNSKGVNEIIKIKTDYSGAGSLNYYVPHLFPLTLIFSYSGNSMNGGCTNSGTCQGIYQYIHSESGGLLPQAELINAISNTPPATIIPKTPGFQINVY